jgi:hypothetical protein
MSKTTMLRPGEDYIGEFDGCEPLDLDEYTRFMADWLSEKDGDEEEEEAESKKGARL